MNLEDIPALMTTLEVCASLAEAASTRPPSQASCVFASERSSPGATPQSAARRSSSISALKKPEKCGSPARAITAQAILKKGDLGWIKGRALGAGSFGTVSKALDPVALQVFAVKEVLLDSERCTCDKQRERLEVELTICQSLRHPNIVSYLGHDYTDRHLYIYLECVAGGSIASLLSEFGPLQENALKKTTSGVLRGLDYLHTRSPPVVHRDLKGANLLVDLEMTVKLADFGCSKWSSETKSFTTLGSIPWMAPEVISQAEGYGRKADIWSFGCTIIEMATAEKPWGDGAFDNMMFALNHIANSGS